MADKQPENEKTSECRDCPHSPHIGGCMKCDCKTQTIYKLIEPILTCSEVVERLSECVGMGTLTQPKFDRQKATAILHSWRDAELLKVVGQDRFHLRKQIEEREHRVQKLEEALRVLIQEMSDHREFCNDCGDALKVAKHALNSEWREQIKKESESK